MRMKSKHATAILIVLGMTSLAADRAVGTVVFTLTPSTHGNPEGVTFDPRSNAFFVGATGDGTVYRGTLDTTTVSEFIPGAPGRSAIGMKASRGKLYVAGGATGAISVFDIATGDEVAEFATGTGGFLNDLVVTPAGDVYVTDSFRPMLWHVTADQVAAGAGTVEAIPVSPEIQYVAGFNLNGIVARKGGDELIVVQSNTGKLFRIDFDEDAVNGRTIQQIAVEPLVGGDGMLLDRGRLIVVQGGPPPTLTFVQLEGGARRGRVVERRTDPTLRGPSTIARARQLYLVVNADFATSRTPFTVSGIPRQP
jgi:sugar lactone lactonase YvrE